MSVRDVAAVADEPRVKLTAWRLLEATFVDEDMKPTVHLVGIVGRDRAARVSSPILQVDVEPMSVQTERGRVYELGSRAGSGGQCNYVWSCWRHFNVVAEWMDITGHVLVSRPELVVGERS